MEEARRFVARNPDAHTPPHRLGRLLILAGEYEQQLAPFQRDAPDAARRLESYAESRIVDNARAMAVRLASAPGLDSKFELVLGENHMSILPQSLNLAVRFAFCK